MLASRGALLSRARETQSAHQIQLSTLQNRTTSGETLTGPQLCHSLRPMIGAAVRRGKRGGGRGRNAGSLLVHITAAPDCPQNIPWKTFLAVDRDGDATLMRLE